MKEALAVVLLAGFSCSTCSVATQTSRSLPANGGPRWNVSSTEGSKLGVFRPHGEVVQRWMDSETRLKDAISRVFKEVGDSIVRVVYTADVSSRCLQDLLRLSSGVRRLETWAFSMLDASGKLQSGLLSGSLSNFGNYHQCLDISVKKPMKTNGTRELFRGQYCAIDISPYLPSKPRFYKLDSVIKELEAFAKKDTVISHLAKNAQFFYFLAIRIGLCVPSSCSTEDINRVAEKVGSLLHMNVSASWCEYLKPAKFESSHIGILILFGCLGILVALGTTVDFHLMKKKQAIKGTFQSVLVAFSVITNTRKLTNTGSRDGTSFSCLHGLRFITITWVILGHNYFTVNYQMLRGTRSVTQYAEDFAFQAIGNGTVSVDTFFFISGFLVCYLTVHLVQNLKKPFNLKLFICHRIWRLTPTHMAVISLCILAPIFNKGPIWSETTNWALEGCKKNWWANVLFVNNFIKYNEMCLPHTWYIAADMQLYLISLLVLLPLLRWPIVGLTINFLLMLTSIILSGVMTYIYAFPPTMLFVNPDPEQRIPYQTIIYNMPYTHMGAYCIGISLGYVLAIKTPIVLNSMMLAAGWFVSIMGGLSVVYGVLDWNSGKEVDVVAGLFYASLSRFVWGMSVMWVVLICVSGYGGIVNKVLSWKGWIPLSRLTFSAYLVHPIIQVAVVGSFVEEISANQAIAVWVYLGNLAATFSTSYMVSMLVESPALALEKLLLKSTEKKSEKEEPCAEQNTQEEEKDTVS